MQNIEKKDYEIVFCSGRTNTYLINLSKKCKVSRYIISSNGSMIYDQKERQIVYQDKIPFNILNTIYEYCENNKMALFFNTENNRYCNTHLNYSPDDAEIITNMSSIKDKNITQFVLGSYVYEEMVKAKDFLDTIEYLEIANESQTIKLQQKNSKNGFFYDVVLKNTNKGSGIKHFITLLNLKPENCIAIGDHINDISMFKAVEYKIAMGNACDELKQKANFITTTNDEDGVKYALDYIEKRII